MTDIFWNYLAMPLVFGVFLFWLASWIWVFAKAASLAHKAFEKPPYVLTPEDQAAINARVKANTAKIMEAYHH